MSQKTKAELKIQNDALIKANGNEEITGTILNGHLNDFIDSFEAETSETSAFTQKSFSFNSITVSGSATDVVISQKPVYDVAIYLNGERFAIGNNSNARFYFKDSGNTIVKTLGNIDISDILHYNSTELGYTLDSRFNIILTYLISA